VIAEGDVVLEALDRSDQREVAARHHGVRALAHLAACVLERRLPLERLAPEPAVRGIQQDRQAAGGAAAAEEDPAAAVQCLLDRQAQAGKFGRGHHAPRDGRNVVVHAEQHPQAGDRIRVQRLRQPARSGV